LPTSFFTKLTHLEKLRLKMVNISDFSFLKNLDRLWSLTLSGNGLNDVSFLKKLKNLRLLNLRDNKLKDISFLKELKGLRSLSLSGNNLNDVSVVKELEELISLDLSDNVLRNVSFLKELKGLKSLGLSSNKLIDVSFLEELSELKSLDFGGNPLVIVEIVKELKGLISLSLDNANLKDVSFVKDLNGLRFLDLSGNVLSDVSYLKNLNQLRLLNLNYNELTKFSIFKYLKELRSLDLRGNNLADVTFLRELNVLTSLDLRGNNLNDLSFLKDLQKLTSLDLSGNYLSDASVLKELTGLRFLDLSGNVLDDISFLKQLKGLSSLGLNGNGLNDASILQGLDKLTSLSLSDNNIIDASFLKKLKRLTSLRLNGNNINDASFLKELKGLVSLSLNSNKLNDVDFVRELKGLRSIDLSKNKLNEMSFLKKLKSLNSINLSNNRIDKIPPWSGEYYLEIKTNSENSSDCINVSKNPIATPPLDIVDKGRKAISKYYDRLKKEKGTEKRYEAKIIIIGGHGVGKSTLFKKLQDPDSQVIETTDTFGVDIKEDCTLKHPTQRDKKITANLWDFGGRKIQYPLHLQPYFISPDSLFLLVIDNRTQDSNWNFWFRIIDLLGGNPRVVVILNKNKNHSGSHNFSLDKYRQQFKNLRIEAGEADLSSNDSDWINLQNIIGRELLQLPVVNIEVPKIWQFLRDELSDEKKEANYIHINHFFKLCPKDRKNKKYWLSALAYFHRIGMVLHFSDDKNFKNIVFINPKWITDALYMPLHDENKDLPSGYFTREWIYKSWETHPRKYTKKECSSLLSLLQKDKFEICYSTDNKKYIIPMLLPDQQPEYGWDKKKNLRFNIKYQFIPDWTISRLTIRMNQLIENDHVWRSGVLFENHQLKCMAQIIQRKGLPSGLMAIDILISGATIIEQMQFLNTIRHQIGYIHNTSFANIPGSEYVACQCEKCSLIDNPHYFSVIELKKYTTACKFEIECPILKDNVSFKQFLRIFCSESKLKDIEKMEALERRRKQKSNIGGLLTALILSIKKWCRFS